MKNKTLCSISFVIVIVYFLLSSLYFLPFTVPYKLVYPLAFLTICALRLSSWPIVLAMFFSALGDYMGVCNNFWGQMGSFALAHIAYVLYFYRACGGKVVTEGMNWKSGIVVLYGVVASVFVLPEVQGVLKLGVAIYMLLIMTMCILAWRQKNPYYAIGAWLFVLSDTILAWNKFVFHIENASIFIMVPYYLGQLVLFILSIRSRPRN